MDHDLRIDSFLSADLIDRLKKQIRHQFIAPIGQLDLASRLLSAQSNSSRGLLDHIERNFQEIAFRQFQPDLAVLESLKTSSKDFLLIQWDSRLDSGQLPIEASVVTFLDQFPFQTGGGNFQRVRKRNQIFNIEYRSYLFADQLAIAMGNARRLVDENPQE